MEISASQAKLLAIKQSEANMESKIQQLRVQENTDEVKPEKNVGDNKEQFKDTVYPEIVDKAVVSDQAQTMAAKSENNNLVNIADVPKIKTPEQLLIKKAAEAYAANK